MGKRQFVNKQRGFSKSKGQETNNKIGHAKRIRRSGDEFVHLSASGDSSGEHSNINSDGELEEAVENNKETSMYDNLLKKLGSNSESVAGAYKRRQREEEGRSESEEDVDSGSESASMSEGDVDAYDNLRLNSDSDGSELQETGSIDVTEQIATTITYDDDASESDEEHDLIVGHSMAKESTSTSSFSEHLGYKLLKDEVDNLIKGKWKKKWKLPVIGTSNCEWIGTGKCFPEGTDIDSGYDLKLKLYKHWLDNYKATGGNDFHSSKQRLFFSLFNSYKDVLHHNKKPFYLKGLEEDSNIMDAYLVHSLNHILKTRDLLTKNDTKMAKLQEDTKDEKLSSDSLLDRGFTRPKILILLPLASIAFRVVRRLIQLTPSSHKIVAIDVAKTKDFLWCMASKRGKAQLNVENNDRFSDEFGGVEDKESTKPPDFHALFGGNNEDHFMIGIKFTRRSTKLYSDFYSSDMIVASPLGLITKIGEAEVDKEKDIDYLSSIEVLIIDHADVIAMQNWSHVNTVIEHLNRIPSKQHGTDIMRIRHWYLDGLAKFYRQSIILGSYLNPDINALFNHHCLNYQGKVKLVCDYKGVLPKVLLQVRQIYERFAAESIEDVDNARLAYFSNKVFPKIKDSVQGGVMIFISSYFEFVRVRNFLKSQDASFCLLGDYTSHKDISRARVWFFQERRKIMLYTERAHFYHRYKIRGIQNLIIYSLPERKEFYPEIVNMLQGSHNMTATVLFSRFDKLRLERIVGSAPAKRMATSDKGVFVFS